MDSVLFVTLNGVINFDVDVKIFNGGEINVSLPKMKYPRNVEDVTIEVTMMGSDGIIALLQTVDAIRRRFDQVKTIDLIMHYAPYARQDRVCNVGESLSSKVFTSLINSCGFNSVTIADPHSDVITSLIDNCKVIEVVDILRKNKEFAFCMRNLTLVAPDFGATKKVEKLAKQLGHNTVIQGVKHRDLQTGELSGFAYYGDVNGKDLLIVDDICDGGGTFVGLAKALREGGARTVSLYVTHGIFSRGVDHLLKNGINHIITTSSLPQEPRNSCEVLVIEL